MDKLGAYSTDLVCSGSLLALDREGLQRRRSPIHSGGAVCFDKWGKIFIVAPRTAVGIGFHINSGRVIDMIGSASDLNPI